MGWRKIYLPVHRKYEIVDDNRREYQPIAQMVEGRNADAVAALPDLLEACQEVLKCKEDGTFGEDGEQGWRLLRDAVFKAVGP